LTQLSVGAFLLNLLARAISRRLGIGQFGGPSLELTNAVFALALGLVALAVMPLHLGRPRYAFRALLGLRTSWLSREILAFSLFAGLATAFAVAFFVPGAPVLLKSVLGAAGAVAGVMGVVCSVMVYAATGRAHWRGSVTGFKFTMSTLVLGSATVLMISMITSARTASPGAGAPPFVASGVYQLLSTVLLVSAGTKLGYELAALRHFGDRHHSVLKRIALLSLGELGSFTKVRFTCGVLGALVLPALGLVAVRFVGPAATFPVGRLAVLATMAFALCLAGELLERYLFFAAAPASKMPGGIA
jgi:DMSO reductase anchor subunit